MEYSLNAMTNCFTAGFAAPRNGMASSGTFAKYLEHCTIHIANSTAAFQAGLHCARTEQKSAVRPECLWWKFIRRNNFGVYSSSFAQVCRNMFFLAECFVRLLLGSSWLRAKCHQPPRFPCGTTPFPPSDRRRTSGLKYLYCILSKHH